MIKTSTFLLGIRAFILFFLLFIFSGCHKISNGVIEVHKYNLDFGGDKVEGSDRYNCYVVDDKSILLNDGELVTDSFYDSFGSTTIVSEYVYWESESAKSLGYTVKIKSESAEDILGYKTKKVRFVTESGKPGANGYWGEVFNNDSNSGSATVVFYLATNTLNNAFNILVDGVSQIDGAGAAKNLYFTTSTPTCDTQEVGPNSAYPSWNIYNIIKVNVASGTHSWQAPSSSSQENYTGSFTVAPGECKVIKVK